MNSLIIISQASNYFSLALLMGYFILRLVPETARPQFYVSPTVLKIAILIIPIANFLPVLKIIFYIGERLGFLQALKIVLTSYHIGIAWDLTVLFSVIFYWLIVSSSKAHKLSTRMTNMLGIALLLAVIFTIAWASHAGANSTILGTASDFIHLTSVSIWVGIILVIAWFAKNYDHWLIFLKWFSITAISCLAMTAVSGILLMDILVDSYVQSWLSSYGIGLLLKHLFIIPLVFYAILNSTFVKYKIYKDPTFNPLKGVKIESLILLTIFTLTAIFTQQSPAMGHYLTNDAISSLFQWFQSAPVTIDSKIGFSFEIASLPWFFGSFLAFIGTIIAFLLRAPIIIAFLCSSAYAATLFIFFMQIIYVA